MALIKCHECGRDVSTLAAACPGCGAPIRKEGPKPPIANRMAPTDKVLWVILFGLIVAAMSMCTSGGDKKHAEAKPASCADDDLQCLGDRPL